MLTGSGTNKERNFSACLTIQNQSFQFTWNHFSLFIRWNHDAIFSSQATNRWAWLNRIMRLIRCEHAQVTRKSTWSMFFVSWEHFMTCSKEGIQVRNWTAWCQNWISSSIAWPNDIAHFRQHDSLHENKDRSNFIGEHVCICRCRQPL